MSLKRKRMLCFAIFFILFLTLSAYYKINNIPSTIFVRDGETLKSDSFIKLVNDGNEVATDALSSGNKYRKVNVSLLGILPVKSVNVQSVSSNITLYPGGQPIGVKLNTKGVLVVALSDIETNKGKITSPAATSGIEIGDSIVKINGKCINSAEETLSEINCYDGKEIKVTLYKKGIEIEKSIKPVKSSKDNKYRIGLWIRDSTAGVGTLTFYDNKSGKFAALGHPITDVDTGTTLNISTGQIVSSSIVSVRKGIKGNPGELKGIFVDEDIILGSITENTQCGIFGKSNMQFRSNYNKPMNIALRNEIKEGSAKILTTIDGSQPKLYNIEIERLLQQNSPGPKSMIIKVTDKELLKKTGGIVQGMSGSPIIQNDKIVGAVTHVLINKPDTGYGIYIEWMLKDAGILQK